MDPTRIDQTAPTTDASPLVVPLDRPPGRRPATVRRRRRLRWALLLLAVAVVVLSAGCGEDDPSPEVAGTGDSTTEPDGGDTATGDEGEPDEVAYSQCMRDEGISDFPDPGPDGEVQLNLDEDGGIDPSSSQYQAADEACEHLRPRQSDEQQAEDYAARLEYAQCMRDEGISEFPDPQPPSDQPVTSSQQAGDETQETAVDSESPQFETAHEACQDLLPEGDAGPSTNSEGG